ncbi:hypothetical protein CHS0354_035170 [Potamilus streckersoni]|uniref:Tetraspanin n=1 Tax=Potamilus streckersoni TaxID=2493646 RepID=A0AAE0TF37_9BIVA|nr:hypothetical protein CHS0354_035170 [Potamilus streckersoni]
MARDRSEVVGLALAALGTYVLYLKQKTVRDAIDFFFDPASLMCLAGCLIVFVSFFGCMGSLREYTLFLRLYNWILTFFFVGEIVLVIIIFVFYFVPDAKQQLGLFPEKTFKNAIRKYGIVDDDDMQNLIDDMQRTLGCCGFSDDDNGFLDWNMNEYFNCTVLTKQQVSNERCSVPASCCIVKEGDPINIRCGHDVMIANTDGTVTESSNHKPIYKIGCLKAVGVWISAHAIIIGGILIGILVPQMFLMCITSTLRNQILMQKAKWKRSFPPRPSA